MVVNPGSKQASVPFIRLFVDFQYVAGMKQVAGRPSSFAWVCISASSAVCVDHRPTICFGSAETLRSHSPWTSRQYRPPAHQPPIP